MCLILPSTAADQVGSVLSPGMAMQKTAKQVSPELESRQQNTLQVALSKLRDHQQLDMEQVRRVAVERQGAIHVEVHEAGIHRFFVYDTNKLYELKPEDDSKIPLVSKFHDPGFAAEHSIISYRPGRRIVLGPADGEQGKIIKGYKKRCAAQAAEKYAIALAACGPGGFDVPDLLQYETDRDCLVMAKQSGKTPAIAADAAEAWTAIGACLRNFQQFQYPDGMQEFNVQDELDVLDERARRLLLTTPALPGNWAEGRERLGEYAKNLTPALKGLAHRDLHDGQFIVAGKTISLLDFDLICIADVALDAGNLLAHVKLRAHQAGMEAGDAAASICSRAFLNGLGRLDEAGFEQRMLFYQATTFYRLALLYAIRPRWAHLTNTLINEGQRCLKALGELRGRP